MTKRKQKTKPKQHETHALADQLRAALQAKGKTVNAMAVAAGVPQPVLYRFVHRQREDLKLSTVEKLAAYLDLRLAPRAVMAATRAARDRSRPQLPEISQRLAKYDPEASS